MSAAPLDGLAVMPDELIEQYVKPAGGDQWDLLNGFRLTAIEWVERHTSRSLARRNWIAMFDEFDETLRLPRDPVRAIVSLGYVDQTGQVASGEGLWRLAGAQLLPAIGTRWPSTARQMAAVVVTFEAGYDDLAVEAPALRIAALMLVKHLFDGGSFEDVPATVMMLLDAQYRTPVIA